MSFFRQVELGGLMVSRGGSVNPALHPSERFTLYSIPAYDAGEPEDAEGRQIGSSKQIVEPGDVLLSKIVPHIRRAWVVGDGHKQRVIASGEWIVFRDNSVNPQYLRHVLMGDQFHRRFMNTVAGVGGSLLRARPAHVARISIPLPPLAEQKRIAAVLDQAMALRARRREVIDALDDLAQSIFLDMFGNPVANEKKWPVRAFGEVCETRLGKMLDTSRQTGLNARPYLRNANVQWFRIDTADLLEMDFSEADRITYELAPGDVLICEGGEPGRAAVWRGEISDCYFQKALHRARPRRGLANPEYIVWLLRMFTFSGGLSDHISTATIAHLTGAKLKNLPIPTPPVLMQEEFARRIRQVEAAKQHHRTHLAVLDELFVSLQQRAFSGTLWDHDGEADAA